MGFYGNVTDTSHTHFQFDKIFPNRLAMDEALYNGTDGIFAGRFVLIKYNPEGDYPFYRFFQGYKDPAVQAVNNIYLYANKILTQPFMYTNFTGVTSPRSQDWAQYYMYTSNRYIPLTKAEDFVSGTPYYIPTETGIDNMVGPGDVIQLKSITTGETLQEFYKCFEEDNAGRSGQEAIWREIILDENYGDYFINYNIDAAAYEDRFDSRGYDATVWEKVYSEGNGKFVLIAHLNGGNIPGFELFPDAPSLTPEAPYIDSKSTDALYRVHVPTKWGFRIKEAESILGEHGQLVYPLSDQIIVQPYQNYDNATNTLINIENREINADIYFNKDGSNKLFNNKDTTTVNRIDILPNGESGKKYWDKDGNLIRTDTYELSVHLPMIGNMIADGYDLIYGSTTDANNRRPTDIEWYAGNETDELKANGNSALGGKTHELTTLAGSLNTIHDIMGQIVVKLQSWPTESQINSLAPQYLYQYGDMYYRKGFILDKTVVPNSRYTYTQQTNITANQFKTNKYYYKDGNNYIEATEYNASYGTNGYYLRNINSVRYTPITLIPFQSGRYYLLEGENYICDNSTNYPQYPDRTYYEVTDDGGKHFTGQYLSNGTFFTTQNNNYIPSTTTEPAINTTYYTINATRAFSGRPYHPGSFYYLDSDNNSFVLATEPTYDSSKKYYVLIFADTPKYGYNELGQVIQYYEVIDYEEDILFTPLQGYSTNQLYVYENREYIAYENIKDLSTLTNRDPYTVSRQYYTLTITAYPSGSLYLPGIYYLKDTNSHNYTKSYANLNTAATYYLITDVTEVSYPFYIPNRYYYQQSQDNYQLSQSATMVSGYQYCDKSAMYVDHDNTGQCPYGYEWNDYAAYIPPSITLYTAERKPGLIAISELGKNTNSLYGLLLELNKLYAPGEEETRDIDTVRGAYNVLQDLLYQIQTLRPGYILQVNDFGQIQSISLSELKSLLNNV